MGRLAIRATIVSAALLTVVGTSLFAGPNRVSSIHARNRRLYSTDWVAPRIPH